MTLYEKLAAEIEALVQQGVLLPGEKIPSVRQAAQHHRLSITTVIRAYLLLESRGMLESRPQSGYFVRARPGEPAIDLQPTRPAARPSPVEVSALVLSTLRSIRADDAVPLGSPYPDAKLFPWQRIIQYANAIGKRYESWSLLDDLPPGSPQLIRQITRRYLENGQAVDPNEVIVTIGATEAINLCLQAVAKPGDTIAVESPTYYAMLHAIKRLGMRAVEVATDPVEGIDVQALARLFDERPVAACMVMPNFQNPLGFQMSDERKQALAKLLTERDIPVIENDVYGELYYGDVHPTSLKAYDKAGIVLHCSSFSKTLTTTPTASAGRCRGAAGALPGSGGAAQVPEHADHAGDSPAGHRRIPEERRLRLPPAARAQDLCAAGQYHGGGGAALFSGRHACVAAGRRLRALGGVARGRGRHGAVSRGAGAVDYRGAVAHLLAGAHVHALHPP